MKLIKIKKIEQLWQNSWGRHYTAKEITDQDIIDNPSLYTIPILENVEMIDIESQGVAMIENQNGKINKYCSIDDIDYLFNKDNVGIGNIFKYLNYTNLENNQPISFNNMFSMRPFYKITTDGGYITNFAQPYGVVNLETNDAPWQSPNTWLQNITNDDYNLTYDLLNVGSWERNEYHHYPSGTSSYGIYNAIRNDIRAHFIFNNDDEYCGEFTANIAGASNLAVQDLIDKHQYTDYYQLKINALENQYSPGFPFETGDTVESSLPFIIAGAYETVQDIANAIRDKTIVIDNADVYTQYDRDFLGNLFASEGVLWGSIYYSHICDYYNVDSGEWEKVPPSAYYAFNNINFNIYNALHGNPKKMARVVAKTTLANSNLSNLEQAEALAKFFEASKTIDSSEVETSEAVTDNVGSNGTNTGGASVGGDGSWKINGDVINNDPLPTIDGLDTGMITTYKMNSANLKALSNWLWSTDFIDNIPRLFGDNPIDSIISLQQTFAGVSGVSQAVKVGTIESPATGEKTNTQYIQMDLGTINVQGVYNTFLDYDGAKASIYLPFIGGQPLNIKEIVNSTISIKYNVDILSGNCVALVHIKKNEKGANNLDATLYNFSGNMNSQIPVTSKNYGDLYRSIIAGAGATVVSGIAGVSLLNNARLPAPQIMTNNSGNHGFISNKTPYVLISVPCWVKANNFWTVKGVPINVNVKLSQLKGYAELSHIHVDSVYKATPEEKENIEILLKNGVVF